MCIRDRVMGELSVGISIDPYSDVQGGYIHNGIEAVSYTHLDVYKRQT